MRKLLSGMNLSLDGYIAVPGDDLDWSRPSDELFQWWLDQERAIGLFLYGRKLWETTSSHWPTGDQQSSPGEHSPGRRRRGRGDHPTQGRGQWTDEGRWRDARGAAMRAGLIDEYAIVTHPVLVGGGIPFFTALDSWVNLHPVGTRTFRSGMLLNRYETRR